MRLLVTGAAGSIGSNFVRGWLDRRPDDHVVALDRLTHAGDPCNLDGLGVMVTGRPNVPGRREGKVGSRRRASTAA